MGKSVNPSTTRPRARQRPTLSGKPQPIQRKRPGAAQIWDKTPTTKQAARSSCRRAATSYFGKQQSRARQQHQRGHQCNERLQRHGAAPKKKGPRRGALLAVRFNGSSATASLGKASQGQHESPGPGKQRGELSRKRRRPTANPAGAFYDCENGERRGLILDQAGPWPKVARGRAGNWSNPGLKAGGCGGVEPLLAKACRLDCEAPYESAALPPEL